MAAVAPTKDWKVPVQPAISTHPAKTAGTGLTAQTAPMMSAMLAAGMGSPGIQGGVLELVLALTTGMTRAISPYATGPGLKYHNSGYISPAGFWHLVAIFGLIVLIALLAVGVPLLG